MLLSIMTNSANGLQIPPNNSLEPTALRAAAQLGAVGRLVATVKGHQDV
ncbi:MAG: hypothetical protein ACPL4I_11510 [Bacteroidota bacterium]